MTVRCFTLAIMEWSYNLLRKSRFEDREYLELDFKDRLFAMPDITLERSAGHTILEIKVWGRNIDSI